MNCITFRNMMVLKNTKKLLSILAVTLTLFLVLMYSSENYLRLKDLKGAFRSLLNFEKSTDDINNGNICYVPSPKTEDEIHLGCEAKHVELFEKVKFSNLSFYMEKLGFENYSDCSVQQRPSLPEVPVIVSGISSNHYKEAVAMCNNLNNTLRKKYNDIKFIIFDLGIGSFKKKDIFQKFCGCEIRRFPFSSFPKHVRNLKSYTWKSLIISLMLKEFSFVMWIDTSIRFDLNKPIENLFQRAQICHIQVCSGTSFAVGETSDIKTMEFLKQNISDHMNTGGDVAAGWAVYLRSKFTITKILMPLVKCALTYGCMLTKTYSSPGPCSRRHPDIKTPGLCHRFDQSVIGIILSSLYREKMKNVLFNRKWYGAVKRGHAMNIPKAFLRKFNRIAV